MNSLRNPSKFIEESEWIHGRILVNSLRKPSEFIEESLWIHWGILVNSLRNSFEFVDEFKWIHWWILMNLLKNSNHFFWGIQIKGMMWNVQIPKMPLSHPKDVTAQSNRVRRKVLKSFLPSKIFFCLSRIVLYLQVAQLMSRSVYLFKPMILNDVINWSYLCFVSIL